MEIFVQPVTGSDDQFIIYRPLAQIAFVGNRAMVDVVQLLTDETVSPKPKVSLNVLNFLHLTEFLKPDGPVLPPAVNTPFKPTMAVLLLTNQCQLRCTYCYAAAGEAPQQHLTVELAATAIDTVCQNAHDLGLSEFEVMFHGGGEPTFAWSTLKACVEYACQKSLVARISMVSNGIWSREQCQWLIDNIDGMTISIDGNPETQDCQRPLRSGEGSSKLVMCNIAELDRHEFPYSLRMTATPPWTLPDDVRYLCDNTNCLMIQVEPAFNRKRGGHFEPSDDEIEGFVQAFVDAHEIARQHGRHLHYAGARLGVVTNTFCTAPYNALIINGIGDVVTCYEVASELHPLSGISRIGHIDEDEVRVNLKDRQRLHQLMHERRTTCEGCLCYWTCAGDCYARAMDIGEEGHLKKKGRCIINQRLTEKMLLSHIADGNGVWHGEQHCEQCP